MTFSFAFNSQVRSNMNLSPYELVFRNVQEPKKPIMFNLTSTTDRFRNCKPSSNSPCNSFPKHTHTDHHGHYPQNEKSQTRNFAHCFLYRKKIHSEVYNEVHNYLPKINIYTSS